MISLGETPGAVKASLYSWLIAVAIIRQMMNKFVQNYSYNHPSEQPRVMMVDS